MDRCIPEYRQLVDATTQQLIDAAHNYLQGKRIQLETAQVRLEGFSPLQTLRRGYSATFVLPREDVVRDVAQVAVGDLVKTRLARGSFMSRVEEAAQ